METFIDAPGPHGLLKGTMLGPASKHAPVVLIIPGSGPTDRDGNSPLGINASTYRLLAEGLAARNITTVRIDKRGLFASAAAAADPDAVTIADYVTDIDAWVNVIRQHTGAPGVWLLGHSEGGSWHWRLTRRARMFVACCWSLLLAGALESFYANSLVPIPPTRRSSVRRCLPSTP